MDLLDRVCKETGNKKSPHRESAHRAHARKTQTLLLARMQASLKEAREMMTRELCWKNKDVLLQ